MSLKMLFVNNTGLPDDQVFVTFQDPGQTLNATYGKSPNTLTVGRKATNDMMTKSYSLTEIGSEGFDIINAEGPVVFISYQATKQHGGFDMGADLSGNEQPSYIGSGGANYLKAYQPFEITCVKGATDGQGNLTNINYLTAPISIQSYKGGIKGTLLQTRGYYNGTATGTSKLNTALSAITTGPHSSLATVTNAGKILRYIGPSSYGAGTNPYPTFDAYLTSINAANKLVTKIQNGNAFNTMQIPAAGNLNYDYQLDFTATVAADNSITLEGDITTTITPFGGKPYAGTTYTGAKLTISPTNGISTSADIFNNTIYGQADPKGPNKGSTTFNSVWDTLKADMAKAGLFLNSTPGTTYATTQSLAIGEITTGLLGGFVGSGVKYSGGKTGYTQYDGKYYKDIPSAAWWNSDTIPSPATLQPDNSFYSAYSNVIFNATNNEVYSIPFSDRFGKGPLMQTQLYNSDTVDTWVVTLGKPLFML